MGAAVWVGVSAATPISVALVPGVDTKTAVLFGAVIAAGAALTPDLDHPNGTIAHSLPPVTKALAHGVSAVSGGHRNGTHSLLAALIVPLLVVLSFAGFWHGELFSHPFGYGVALFTIIFGAFASKALKVSIGSLGAWPSAIVLGVAAGFLIPNGASWLPWAVGIGYVVHLLGDFITKEGIPFFYPFSKKRYSLPLLGTAGSTREHVLTVILSLYLVATLVLTGASSLPWA